jgi:hypothetical protein
MELESILDDLAAIREAIDELPSAPFTKSTIRSLAKAVEKEEEGFVGLHEQFSSHLDDQGPAPGFFPPGFIPLPTPAPPGYDEKPPVPAKGEEPPEPGLEVPKGSQEPPDESMDPTKEGPDVDYDQVDAPVNNSKEVLAKAQGQLKEWLDDPASAEAVEEEDLEDVLDFQATFEGLVQSWDDFHDDYDQWRLTNGACNESAVASELAGFSTRLNGLSAQVGGLPHASFLQPMSDSLLRAAQREEEAMRALRRSWQPFDADSYRALEQERSNAAQVRRQVQVGVQELLARFGVSGG